MKADAISVVEAAYELEPDLRGWLLGLVERAAPHLDRGLGLVGTMWHLGHGPEESTIVTHRVEDRVLDALHASVRTDRGRANRQAAADMIFGTTSQRLGLEEGGAQTLETCIRCFHPVGFRECLALCVPDPEGHVVSLVAPIPDVRIPTPAETARWSRIAAHIAAGARLRKAHPGRHGDVAQEADAVLSPAGAVLHAEPAAKGKVAREALRGAARDVDRARSTARGDDDRALDLWQGLVAGRWSLVDRFDSDGRRFLVARRNDPDVPDPRALTRRERQVLAYAAMGQPLKLIAYALGLSVSTIALYRGRAMRKLGLTSTAEVVRMFAREPAKETAA